MVEPLEAHLMTRGLEEDFADLMTTSSGIVRVRAVLASMKQQSSLVEGIEGSLNLRESNALSWFTEAMVCAMEDTFFFMKAKWLLL